MSVGVTPEILASAVILTSCNTAQIDAKSDLDFNNKVQN